MLHTLTDFLDPVNPLVLSGDEGFKDAQLGKHITIYENDFPDLQDIDMVLVGCSENSGAGPALADEDAPDRIRKQFYALYHWHKNVRVADLGNIKKGASLNDRLAALRAVVKDLVQAGKKVIILGGTHDLALQQYKAYAELERVIEVVNIDSKIDLCWDSPLAADRFLMEMLTGQPNFVKHYNHIGFQSYLVHPDMLETIDKLRFDCFRLGTVREKMEEMEPVIRNTHLFSFDITAIQHANAPANHLTPNGFTGEEACMLMQYAGMSRNTSSIGIYGYLPSLDTHDLTAKQISQMLWYVMDGMYKGREEAGLHETEYFNEFKLAFSEMQATFLQSKKTGRWWMQMPDGKYIACSPNDYTIACANDIPERWMRAMERS
ncbi:MAG: formimidoylglutamase [Chitinophagaceae bacterium]|nr:formimidoylglutamase [Chitinophagaceae bacterium]